MNGLLTISTGVDRIGFAEGLTDGREAVGLFVRREVGLGLSAKTGWLVGSFDDLESLSLLKSVYQLFWASTVEGTQTALRVAKTAKADFLKEGMVGVETEERSSMQKTSDQNL